MNDKYKDDLGFTYIKTKSGEIIINYHNKKATVLRSKKVDAFIEKESSLNFAELQQLMARLTGNYKRGNEKLSKNHNRNAQ